MWLVGITGSVYAQNRSLWTSNSTGTGETSAVDDRGDNDNDN